MSYSFKVPPPWQTGYALPGYIAEHSPVFYPRGVSRYAGAALGGLGATPPVRSQVGPLVTAQSKADIKLDDGPRWQIGRWLFKPERNSKIYITGRDTVIWKQMNPGQGEYPGLTWLANRMAESQRGDLGKVIYCRTGFMQRSDTFLEDFQGLKLEGQLICVSEFGPFKLDRPIHQAFWRGIWPIVGFENPETKEKWGLYTNWESPPSGPRVVLSIRKFEWPGYERSMWGKIWDVLAKIVAVIVDTYKAMFDFFKAVTCAIAAPLLANLSGVANKKQPLTPQLQAQAYASGAPPGSVALLATNPTAAGAVAIGNGIAKVMCGEPSVAAVSGLPGWVWPVAIVGGAALAAKLLKGR